MAVIHTDTRAPVLPPASDSGWSSTLLAAMIAVATSTHDSAHGFDACDHPHQFAQCVCHDLDPLVPLPAGATG
ncbi:hypothetical protein [Frankia gtarii]|uniref:hypothetical protein n=1 Tax=Frankia gtarii TaxID=2950102 RepID=UPI0021C1BA91|nr:hypothetical protein [Frankia gtarii]